MIIRLSAAFSACIIWCIFGMSTAAQAYGISIEAPEGTNAVCDRTRMMESRLAGTVPMSRAPRIMLSASGFKAGRAYNLTVRRIDLKRPFDRFRSVGKLGIGGGWGNTNFDQNTLILDELKPGNYVAILKESSDKRTFVQIPRYVVAEEHFTVSLSQPEMGLKDRYLANEPITVSLGEVAAPYEAYGSLILKLVPQFSDLQNSDKGRVRTQTFSSCHRTKHEFAGLPVGNYDARIYSGRQELARQPFVVVQNDLGFFDTVGRYLGFGGDQMEVHQTPASNALACGILNAFSKDLNAIDEVADHADHAILAWAAYGGQPALEMAADRGWVREEVFAEEQWFSGDTIAHLFVHQDGRRVLAFRGTSVLPDWISNTLGMVSGDLWDNQVEDARKIAEKVKAGYGKVTYVGHSLGGRMAQVASLETGNPPVVFNSSPLAPHETVLAATAKYLDRSPAVVAFRSPEDPVSIIGSKYRDVTVRNILKTDSNRPGENILSASYTHSAEVLARSMFEVQMADAAGWLDTANCVQTEPFRNLAAAPNSIGITDWKHNLPRL
jgi:hypothetical protein